MLTGAKRADLAPTTILASPLCILLHSSYLSPLESLLCRMAIILPNLAKNLSVICGVKEISGTSIIAFFPSLIILSIKFR